MKSYQCEASITFSSNKGTNTYKVMQFSKITGEYRIQVMEPEKFKNTVTICDNKKIVQADLDIQGKVVVALPNKARQLTLLNSFINHYLEGEETAMASASMDETKLTVIEATIPGSDDSRLAFEKLWIDNETLLPVKMCIYNEEGKESIAIEYENFKYNVELEDKLFDTENITK